MCRTQSRIRKHSLIVVQIRRNPIRVSLSLYRNRNRNRNHVERFLNSIKHCGRMATRYDKLAANILAIIKLATISTWPSVYESTSS